MCHNGYRFRKQIRRGWLHFATLLQHCMGVELMHLRKPSAKKYLKQFSLQLWVILREDWALQPRYGNKSRRRKTLKYNLLNSLLQHCMGVELMHLRKPSAKKYLKQFSPLVMGNSQRRLGSLATVWQQVQEKKNSEIQPAKLTFATLYGSGTNAFTQTFCELLDVIHITNSLRKSISNNSPSSYG